MTGPILQELDIAREHHRRTVAAIGRSQAECERLHDLLRKETDLSLQLLTEEETFQESNLVILPSHVAKGLEFDQVILVNLEEPYTEDELDLKLLYVAMTRPLHRLALFAREGMFPLLEKLDDRCYQRI
ncbi:UvrD-like helicase family protein [Melghirimyces profundicolus]|uniref:UvrD-like helicase family protein n=1 Tax=Melghirimyces profundicolus TaxID=1242148 RepID=A0A2T6C0B6_9BACL|nr:3'-5' exonuclease [Melghirimyces profundicolus]PTX61765.1 UvrD-like helicase family protein [Melghirimyces profundicolus]